MPNVGRRPIPLGQRIAAGDPQANKLRKLQELEPQMPGELPECPEHLTGLAREKWEDWAASLTDAKVSKRCDAAMLEGACVAYQRAVQADAILQREGLTVEGPHGIKAHPAIGISEKMWRQVRSFCIEFGLSPSSRTRVAIDTAKQTEGKSLAELLTGEGAE